jgi:hypothetical protein
MADPIADFFDALSQRGHVPTLRDVKASMRFDVVDGESIDHWLVAVDSGDIGVTRSGGDAQCVVRAERRLFERIVTGQMNPMAAMLRGEIAVSGDLELLVLIQQRLFPGPATRPGPAGPAPTTTTQPASAGGR